MWSKAWLLDNNDNINNNNQISDSADAQNMGNAGRELKYEFEEGLKFFFSKLCLPYLICQFHKDEQGGDSITSKVALVRNFCLL